MSSRRRRPRALVLSVLALVLTAAASAYATTTLRGDATAKKVVRETLAAARNPEGAPNRTLVLARVTVAPGASLPVDRRGTSLAYVVRGKLHYRIRAGHITVGRGAPDARGDAPVRRQIRGPGETTIRSGEWFDTRPGTVDRATNTGSKPTKILFASLPSN